MVRLPLPGHLAPFELAAVARQVVLLWKLAGKIDASAANSCGNSGEGGRKLDLHSYELANDQPGLDAMNTRLSAAAGPWLLRYANSRAGACPLRCPECEFVVLLHAQQDSNSHEVCLTCVRNGQQCVLLLSQCTHIYLQPLLVICLLAAILCVPFM